MTQTQFALNVALATAGILLLLAFVTRLAVLDEEPPKEAASASTQISTHLRDKP